MIEKIEAATAAVSNDRPETSDEEVRSLPNLESWMNKIEEFVAEITNDLNGIGKALGDRTLSAGSRGNSNSPNVSRSTNGIEPTTDNEDGEQGDRLGSLKRRLANLKQESSPASSEEEANIDG